MACKIDLSFTNGDKMPALGIGTWRAPDEEVEKALNEALEVGYRHIDTAPAYFNEKTIGKVLKSWFDSGKLQREDIFITTKLPPTANRASCVEKYLRMSLADLQLEYVDLYLIHVPFGLPETAAAFKKLENGDLELAETDHVATWKELERMQSEGLAKHIGVSNFNQRQIQRLLDNSVVKPENLQIELHLYLQQKELVDFCYKNNILVTAYSPLGSKGIDKLNANAGITREIPDLMENPEVVRIAKSLEKTPAQILLRHIIQRGISAIPKSTNAGRLRLNIELFDFVISEKDMVILGDLDADIRICDFAFFPGVEKHPEFSFTQHK